MVKYYKRVEVKSDCYIKKTAAKGPYKKQEAGNINTGVNGKYTTIRVYNGHKGDLIELKN